MFDAWRRFPRVPAFDARIVGGAVLAPETAGPSGGAWRLTTDGGPVPPRPWRAVGVAEVVGSDLVWERRGSEVLVQEADGALWWRGSAR